MSGPAEVPGIGEEGPGEADRDLFGPIRMKIAASHARGYAAGYVEGHADGGMRKAMEIVRNLLKLGADAALVLAAAEIPAGWEDGFIGKDDPMFDDAVGELVGTQDGIYAWGYGMGCVRGLAMAHAFCEEARAKLLSFGEDDPMLEAGFEDVGEAIGRKTSDEGRAEVRAEGHAAGRADGAADGGAKMAVQMACTLLLHGADADLVAAAAGLSPEEVNRLAGSIARGEARGTLDKAMEIARNFLDMGLDPAAVAKGAGLPLADVERLAAEMR